MLTVHGLTQNVIWYAYCCLLASYCLILILGTILYHFNGPPSIVFKAAKGVPLAADSGTNSCLRI